jgi:hypothetical protein
MFVFSENLGETYLDQTFGAVAAILLIAGMLVLLLAGLLRNPNKAAFVTTLLLVFIFIHSAALDSTTKVINIPPLIFLLGEITLFLFIGFITLRSVTNWTKLNQTLNFMTGILLLLAVSRIVSYGFSDGAILQPKALQQDTSHEGFTLPDNPPNVFFILVDAYARADVLNKYFGYDNSDFIDFLKKSGFAVADNSFGNYHHTPLAANTALNFEYITDTRDFADATPKARGSFLNNKILNNQAGSIFNALGYEVVTIQSNGQYVRTAGATELTPDSNWLVLNDFETALLDTTLFPRVFKTLIQQLRSERSDIKYVIDEIGRQSAKKGPRFVIAHMTSPHPPFIFDREGNVPNISRFDFGKLSHLKDNVEAYGDQVHYLNTMLKVMIDEILANSESMPIIILQGDHGLRLSMYINQLRDRTTMEDACFAELYPNLNAMYLPGDSAIDSFYDSITPANTFRLILDNYFGGNLGLLEDRSFYPEKDNDSATMNFTDISGQQNSCSKEWAQLFEISDTPD